MKIVCTGLLLLAAVSASGTAVAQACPGKLIAVKDIRNWDRADGPKLGELQLYWDSTSNKNCARTVHTARTWNKPLKTSLIIQTCERKDFKNGYCTAGAKKYQNGVYKFQAGPLSLPGGNRCVWTQGGIDPYDPSRPASHFHTNTIAGHCR